MKLSNILSIQKDCFQTNLEMLSSLQDVSMVSHSETNTTQISNMYFDRLKTARLAASLTPSAKRKTLFPEYKPVFCCYLSESPFRLPAD